MPLCLLIHCYIGVFATPYWQTRDVLQAPEGFAGIEAEYTTPETYSDVHIALQKAA